MVDLQILKQLKCICKKIVNCNRIIYKNKCFICCKFVYETISFILLDRCETPSKYVIVETMR